LLILMLTWNPASAVTTCQSWRIPLRDRDQPNNRDDPWSTIGNNITPPRDDDRDRIANTRQAAEALFTPKRQSAEPSVSDPAPPAERPARKPRVLAILSPTPVRNEEVAAPVDPEPRTTRQVPRSHHARIRTWVNYGLTIPQVAEVYGGVIERILREGWRMSSVW
jgi:hypothetical protein